MTEIVDCKSFISQMRLNLYKYTIRCPKHGETEGVMWTQGEHSLEQGICLQCAEEERAKEQEALALQYARYKCEELHRKYQNCNIELEYWDKSLADYIPRTKSQQEAKNATIELIQKRSGKLVLLGSNGVGKTFLGCMAVKALGGKILSMYEISTMIRQSYTAKATKSELEIVKELASIPMLVIDEMGRTKGSNSELNWLSSIFDKRHTRNLPTMLLSNTHRARLCPVNGCDFCFERFVNNDVLSRLQQNSKIITIQADDYRAQKQGAKK